MSLIIYHVGISASRSAGGGGGRILACISHIDMCRPEGHGFCAILGLKTDVLPILVWKRVWFSRELRECMNDCCFSSKRILRKSNKRIRSGL